MPRIPVKDNSRVALRIRAADKAKILRAVLSSASDLTTFILENTLRAADSVIERAEPDPFRTGQYAGAGSARESSRPERPLAARGKIAAPSGVNGQPSCLA